MTRPLVRLRRKPIAVSDASGSLVARYLESRDQVRHLRYTGIPAESPLAEVTIELIDTTGQPSIHADHATLWHVLWIRDETIASAQVEGRDEAHSWPIAPGDTVPIPAGSTLNTAGDQLGLVIGVPEAEVTHSAPTHGTEQFFGYNRQTVAFQIGNRRVCRWKVTQPLPLADHYSQPVLVMALARTVTVRTNHSIEQLRQGDVALIDPQSNPTVLPDGIAYLLTIDVTNPN